MQHRCSITESPYGDEATVLEMDRVESSNGGGDLWKTITAAEYWERQNKALLSLPDSDEPRGSLGPADRPKPHAVDAQTLAADVECLECKVHLPANLS